MNIDDEIAQFSKAIAEKFRKRDFKNLEPLMHEIVLREQKLMILSGLCGRLPSLVVHAFFLCGLHHLNEMSIVEYRKLYELSTGNEIAIYQLTWFLIMYGGARKEVLTQLCVRYSEIEKIEQFSPFLKKENALPDNEKKMNELCRQEYGVPALLLENFIKKFAALSERKLLEE